MYFNFFKKVAPIFMQMRNRKLNGQKEDHLAPSKCTLNRSTNGKNSHRKENIEIESIEILETQVNLV